MHSRVGSMMFNREIVGISCLLFVFNDSSKCYQYGSIYSYIGETNLLVITNKSILNNFTLKFYN